jgi:hypothetical protein
MLQIPVTVLAETTDRAQVQEETHTLVVNAHGGLLKLKMELLAGQPIVLVNPQSGMEQSCRVVPFAEVLASCISARGLGRAEIVGPASTPLRGAFGSFSHSTQLSDESRVL